MRWRRFPFSSLPDFASGGVSLFCKREEPFRRTETPAFPLFAFSFSENKRRKDSRPKTRRCRRGTHSLSSSVFCIFLFLERREIHENGRHSSSLFWKKGRERPSGGKSKKDGGSSLLTTDSDSMAISFFSFSLLKGWQGDAFHRRDEKDSFPRRKTENGDPARKAALFFFFFQRKIKSRLLEARTKEGETGEHARRKESGRARMEDGTKKKKERRTTSLS